MDEQSGGSAGPFNHGSFSFVSEVLAEAGEHDKSRRPQHLRLLHPPPANIAAHADMDRDYATNVHVAFPEWLDALNAAAG